jgi:3-methyl-2-oxobutanoate hydroxymethyltransferase
MVEAKVTIPALLQMKRDGRKSVGVVAWDYQIARIADRAGVDIVSWETPSVSICGGIPTRSK